MYMSKLEMEMIKIGIKLEGLIRLDKTLSSVEPNINFYIEQSTMFVFHGRKTAEL
jgi:hypothetical protein